MTSIEKIEIFSPYNQKLTLVLGDSSNGLEVRELDGVDPTKAVITTSSYSRQAGTQRQASRREARTLKIKLGFDLWYGEETVEKLRQSLYTFFMPQMQVTCRYHLESGLVVDVRGEVEDFASPRSVEDPEATIQIYCFDPDFIGEYQVQNGKTTSGIIPNSFTYDGTVPTGFLFTLAAFRDIGTLELRNLGPNVRTQTMVFNKALSAGDVLTISTAGGQKGAWIRRDGVTKSALQGVSFDSTWIELLPGINQFRVVTEGASANFTVSYTNRYGGI